MLLSFVAPPRLRSPRQNPPATTASRSSPRDELSCGPSRSLQPGPPSRCPPYPPPPLLPSPELSMAEITITQRPAHVRHGSNIGQPLTRRDGILKVTGSARYAADNHTPRMLYAVLAVSSIARGRVTFLDGQAANSHSGVVEVMTPTNKPT